jgi:hypothetical protein
MIPRIDVSRRYFPSCASSPRRPLLAALASAPNHLHVTGPPAYRPHRLTRTGRRAPLMRFRLRPCGVRWSRRTAWSLPAPSHPASALFLASAPTPRGLFAHAVFSASRLACFSVARFARRRRAGHSWPISFGPTYRIRAGCYRDLTGTVKIPATPMGFTFVPFAVLLPSAGDGVSSTPRTHLPFCHLPPRVSSSRSSPLVTANRRFVAAAPGVWPRAANRAV